MGSGVCRVPSWSVPHGVVAGTAHLWPAWDRCSFSPCLSVCHTASLYTKIHKIPSRLALDDLSAKPQGSHLCRLGGAGLTGFQECHRHTRIWPVRSRTDVRALRAFCCVAGIPKNLRGGIASVLFALPVIKHNYAWAGCMPAGQFLPARYVPSPPDRHASSSVLASHGSSPGSHARPLPGLLPRLDKVFACGTITQDVCRRCRVQAHVEAPEGAWSLPECDSRGDQG